MSRGKVVVSSSQTGGTTTHQLRHIRTRQSVREHSLVHDEVEVVWKRVVPQGYIIGLTMRTSRQLHQDHRPYQSTEYVRCLMKKVALEQAYGAPTLWTQNERKHLGEDEQSPRWHPVAHCQGWSLPKLGQHLDADSHGSCPWTSISVDKLRH